MASQVAVVVKNPPANAGDLRAMGWIPVSQRRVWQLIPIFLPGESHEEIGWWAIVHMVTELNTIESTYYTHLDHIK